MLTARGASFLIGLLAFIGGAIALDITGLTLIGLTLLVWFLTAWFTFVVRVRWTAQRLPVRRLLLDAKGPQRNLWARSPCTVQVELVNNSGVSLPYVRITDRLPLLLEGRRRKNHADGPVARGTPLRF